MSNIDSTEQATLAAARNVVSSVLASSVSKVAPSHSALNPHQFLSLRIREVTELSPSTKAFDVLLPHDDDYSGLIASSFIMVGLHSIFMLIFE